ncbi:MAG TPA: hypothetical protein VN900_16785 [Stellaceae bacterium]|jgi:hypothetical protein|nr:hypothetical protein [Stellaceae bacterium]
MTQAERSPAAAPRTLGHFAWTALWWGIAIGALWQLALVLL